MRVLVTRPEPAASATAARLRGLGHEVTVAPLAEPRAVPWRLPEPLPAGVVFTSANAARLGGPQLRALTQLPAYAVGDATAAAVRTAGFMQVEALGGTAGALFGDLAARGAANLLHLAGDVRSGDAPASLCVAVRTVYAVTPVATLPPAACDALAAGALTLLYSPRGAALFAALAAAASVDRARLPIAAISAATATAAGSGWQRVAVAAQPTEAALLAAAALTCETDGPDR